MSVSEWRTRPAQKTSDEITWTATTTAASSVKCVCTCSVTRRLSAVTSHHSNGGLSHSASTQCISNSQPSALLNGSLTPNAVGRSATKRFFSDVDEHHPGRRCVVLRFWHCLMAKCSLGVHFFPRKSWQSFLKSSIALETQAKTIKLSAPMLLIFPAHRKCALQFDFLLCLGALTCLGVHLHLSPLNSPQFFFSALGVHVHPLQPWLRVWIYLLRR